jgi:hypothetical protein
VKGWGYYPFGNGVDGRDPLHTLHDGIVVHPDAQLAEHWRAGRDEPLASG